MVLKFKEGSTTRGHKAALVDEQCRLHTREYFLSHRVINAWNKQSTDCVNTSSVDMFVDKIDISYEGGLYMYDNIVGLFVQLPPGTCSFGWQSTKKSANR